jgi:hypothetical protein
MRFTRFGITLEKLQRQHLEQVRCWRNSGLVLPYMRYREVIQPEDQIRWFEAIDPGKNWYLSPMNGCPIRASHQDID